MLFQCITVDLNIQSGFFDISALYHLHIVAEARRDILLQIRAVNEFRLYLFAVFSELACYIVLLAIKVATADDRWIIHFRYLGHIIPIHTVLGKER